MCMSKQCACVSHGFNRSGYIHARRLSDQHVHTSFFTYASWRILDHSIKLQPSPSLMTLPQVPSPPLPSASPLSCRTLSVLPLASDMNTSTTPFLNTFCIYTTEQLHRNTYFMITSTLAGSHASECSLSCNCYKGV